MPVGNLNSGKQARSHQPPPQDEKNTRSPELAPPQAVISSQTLAAFSDDADEYEPTHLTFTYLIPHELSQLDVSVAQNNALTRGRTTAQTSHPSTNNPYTNQRINKTPTTKGTDGNDEHLLELIPPGLAELSITAL